MPCFLNQDVRFIFSFEEFYVEIHWLFFSAKWKFTGYQLATFDLFVFLSVGLAGATADVHCYDVLANKWTR
jgi:hypothetical protein